eukprot:4999811-Pleurochrysis_carterae.AAC.1
MQRNEIQGLKILLPRASVAASDNFLNRAAGGLMVDDEPGAPINMTNLASLAIPKAALSNSDLHEQIEQMVDNGD